jgi:hypothetical protein
MNETLPQYGQDSEGVPTPSDDATSTEVGFSDATGSGTASAPAPVAAVEVIDVAGILTRTLPEGELSETQPRPEPQPAHGTSVMPAPEAAAAAAEAALGVPPAPAFGAEIPQTFGADLPPEVPQPMLIQDEEDDGLPGGPIPSSSGFSWRLPGTPAPAPVSQGGIPNEFDHLFRDSGAESRRSLMPGQGAIGVSVPVQGAGAAPGPQGPVPGQGQGHGQPGPGYPGASHPGAEAYQQDGYPQQPYLAETGGMYDQGGFQTQAQVPVGAPADEVHTQSLPRVQVQYGGPGQGNPDLLLATGGPTRSSSNRTVLVAAGVLVVLVVIAMFAFSGGGGTKKNTAKPAADTGTPTVSAPPGVDPAARAQADAIYAVIQQSQGLTGKANGAITDVEKCSNVQQAAATFTDVADRRQAQSDAVAALPADKLPDGAALVKNLQQAWQYSATSERELAAWATDNASCNSKPGNNDNRNKANSDGTRAGSLKATAADQWNAAAAKTAEASIKRTDL